MSCLVRTIERQSSISSIRRLLSSSPLFVVIAASNASGRREEKEQQLNSRSLTLVSSRLSTMESSSVLTSTMKNNHEQIVTLNVGGRVYSTPRSTIETNVDAQSFLALLINDQRHVRFDEQGRYFIDRDGTHFRSILNYFRDGKLRLPETKAELQELFHEAQFYQIDRLSNEIENRLNRKNESLNRDQPGVRLTLVANLNNDGKILKLIGPLSVVSLLFPLRTIGKQLLKIISSSFDLRQISCQFTFPSDDNLITCQALDPLQRFVLAIQARKLSLMVSYCDDYVYVPIEEPVMSRGRLTEVLSGKCKANLLHQSLKSDDSYDMIEHWFIPDAQEQFDGEKIIYSNGSMTSVP